MNQKKIDRLIFILLRLCAFSPNYEFKEDDRDFLLSIKDENYLWKEVLWILEINKISNLVYFALNKNKLVDLIPSFAVKEIFDQYAHTCIKNRKYLNSFDEILGELNKKGIIPAALKGIVLELNYYPDLGMRYMGDLDFYINSSDRDSAMSVFTELGFKRNPNLKLLDYSFDGINEQNILIDVHFKSEFFKNFSDADIYQHAESPMIKNKFLTLEKNAFLAFLIEHQKVHHEYLDGAKYYFFFDLIYFYRRHGAKFDNLERFLKPEHWDFLYKSNSFIKQLAPELEVPFLDKKKSFTVSEIRRVTVFGRWGLIIRYKSWVRLLLTWLGVLKSKYKVVPTFSDVICFFYDRARL